MKKIIFSLYISLVCGLVAYSQCSPMTGGSTLVCPNTTISYWAQAADCSSCTIANVPGGTNNGNGTITWGSVPGTYQIDFSCGLFRNVTVKSGTVVGGDVADVGSCSGDNVTMVVSGFTDQILYWQKSTSSSFASPTTISSTSSSISDSPASDTYYRARIKNSCSASETWSGSGKADILDFASYILSGGGTFCSGESPDLTLLDSESGVTYQLKRNGANYRVTQNGTGNSLIWYDLTAGGTYTVTGTKNGCSATVSTSSTTLTFTSLPTAYTVSGGGTYCADIGATITLSDTETDVSYQLRKYTTAPNHILWSTKSGTGGAINFPGITTAGTYFIDGYRGTCKRKMSGEQTVATYPVPSLTNLPASTTIKCSQPLNFAFTSNLAGTTYSWTSSASAGITGNTNSSGSTLNDVLTFPPGTASGTVTYTVTPRGPTPGFCYGAPQTYTVTVNPWTGYILSGGDNFCSGDQVTLTLNDSETGASYQLKRDGANVQATKSGTGSALTWYLTGVTGTDTGYYTVIANGCAQMTSGTQVTVTNLPTVYNVSGGGTYCSGGTGVSINLSDTESDVSYQLRRYTVAPSSVLVSTKAGTGGAVSFTNVTVAGTHFIDGIRNSCTSRMSGEVTVATYPVPTFTNLPASTTVKCDQPLNFTFASGLGGTTYSWTSSASAGVVGNSNSSGSTLTDALTLQPGTTTGTVTYTVTPRAPAPGLCYGTPKTYTVTVNAYNIYTFTGGGTVCSATTQNVTLFLTLSETGVVYQLQKDGVDDQASKTGDGSGLSWTVDQDGSYDVIANSCTPMGAEQVTFLTVVAPSVPTVSTNTCGDKTLTSGAAPGGDIWYWQGINSNGTDTSQPATSGYTANLSGTDTYYLRAQNDTYSCWSDPRSIIVTVNDIPTLPATINHDQVLQEGTVNLSVSQEGGYTINWFDGQNNLLATGGSYTPYLYQTESFEVETIDGTCTSISRATVTGTVIPLPGIKNTGARELASGQSTTLQVIGTYDTYQWKKDGVNISGTLASYTASEAGRYSAVITLGGTPAETPYISLTKLDATPDGSSTAPVSVLQPDPNISADSLNYVRTFTARMAMDDTGFQNNLFDKDSINTTTQYFDGLGRPSQTVVRRGSPDGYDIVQHVEYDAFGRIEKEYLPYVYQNNVNPGAFRPNDMQEQYDFYQSASNVAHSQVTYSWKKFDGSPLNRILEQAAPGDAWYPGNTFDDDDRKTVKFDQNTNLASIDGDILIWDPQEDWLLVNAGTYSDNELAITVTTDEHGSRVFEFTDKEGKTVLKRVENISQDTDGNDRWLDTYYVYDILGNLIYVIPPQGMKEVKVNSYTHLSALPKDWEWLDYDLTLNQYQGKSYLVKQDKSLKISDGFSFSSSSGGNFKVKLGTPDSAFLDTWAFQYKYDGRQRMTAKKVPGADWTYMVYDQWDRLVLTQDGNQRINDQWFFTKYDQFNRPIMTGIYTDATLLATLRTNIGSSSTRFENKDASATGYTLGLSLPMVVETDLLSVTYYGDYSFPHATDPAFPYVQELGNTSNFTDVLGLVTGTKTRVMDDNTWLKSVSYYDNRYRAIQSITENQNGGTDRVTNKYDFTGKVETTHTVHSPDGVASTVVKRDFAYDHGDRLLTVTHQVDTETEVTLVSNQYNELGELVDKSLHGGLQSVDYRYNLRGWLTSINNAQLSINGLNDDDDDFFGMELYYSDGFAQGQYNGNIAGVKWQNQLDGKQRSYGYLYDPLNRLKFGDYSAYSGATWTDEAGRFQIHVKDYDLSGNIKDMERKGETTTGIFALMDDMTYSYSGNRLVEVDDAIADVQGRGDFYDGAVATDEYHYDANGNMVKDQNKGIANIEYNHLNLPSKVDFGGGKYIEYIYDAAGIKLTQKVYDNSTLKKTTDYMGEFVYENDTMRFIQHEEGRIVRHPELVSGSYYEYQYNIKDHLGNVRLTFTSADPVDTYLATMEPDFATVEEAVFDNMDTRQQDNNFDHTDTPPATGNVYQYSSYLTGGAETTVGPAMILKVGKGDNVDMTVYGKFKDIGTYSTATVAGFIGELANSLDQVSLVIETANEATSVINGAFAAIGSYGGSSDQEPRAYLNYILFDDDFGYVTSGFDRIDATAGYIADPNEVGFDQLGFNLPIDDNGYIYVWLSNETATSEVWFDDLLVEHSKSPIIQVDSYYPFGLSFNSWQRSTAVPNKFLYNAGTERIDDFDLGVDMTDFRVHDPALGRWWQIDPIAKFHESGYAWVTNNPIFYNDPFGLDTLKEVVITAKRIKKSQHIGLLYFAGQKVMKHRDGIDFLNRFMAKRSFHGMEVDNTGRLTGDYTPVTGDPPIISAPLKIVSVVRRTQSLLKIAQKIGKSPQIRKELNKLLRELVKGNFGAGKGAKPIFGNVHEMRGAEGARVYFTNTKEGVKILGYSNKATQPAVIKELKRLYGK